MELLDHDMILIAITDKNKKMFIVEHFSLTSSGSVHPSFKGGDGIDNTSWLKIKLYSPGSVPLLWSGAYSLRVRAFLRLFPLLIAILIA